MPSDAYVLGFDTSVAHCAAALLLGERLIAERVEPMAKGQAERLMPMLQEMLSAAGIGWGDVVRIGVGVGPGNFTGVRIAVSAARGLALALGVPAIGVSAFEAMALGTGAPVLASLDARRGQVYVQRFGRGLIAGSAPEIAEIDDLGRLAAQGLICIGHEATAIAEKLGAHCTAPRHGTAVAIARIAAMRTVGADERPAPMYLRSADAAPARDTGPRILL